MKKVFSNLLILSILGLIGFWGCEKDAGEAPTEAEQVLAKVNSCEGCHTNYDHLKAVADDEEPPTGGHGCGGAPPYYPPYDRVYLGGDGYGLFKSSIHGQMKCTNCHNGVDGTADKDEAHSGDFIAKPSSHAKEKCASCHPSVVARTTNSLHEQGWGQKRMVIQRSGYGTAPTDFDKLPEELQKGYMDNCSGCHGSCGECHIVRPHAIGGGLENGHAFKKTPDMRKNCTACHSSRGGHAYFGEAPGTKPDIHLTKAGYTCIDCHTANEVHGTGEVLETRYKMPLLPKCENCHGDVSSANIYHQTHINTFNCQTCHSQDYNNCGSCHIGGEGARIPSHIKFKIGMNPIPDIKPYKFATVREALSAPDSWQEYGVPVLKNFDSNPTYKYTTPHNIQRWTARTDTTGGKACMESCHIRKEGDQYINKEYYLFDSDLYDWEKNADKDIVVDGKLPASWGL